MVQCNFLRLVFCVSVMVCLAFLFQDSSWLRIENFGKGSLRAVADIDDDYVDEDPKFELTAEEEAKENDDPSLVAPRSHNGPYNEYDPGQRYILYHPSGGFSNQRMEIEYAVEIGKLLNRTVYVPMCGRHTNGWEAYNALREGSDLFPMDRILDFPFMQTYDHRVRVVPLNITVSGFVSKFVKANGVESLLAIPYSKNYYGREQVIKWRQLKQPVIFFKGSGFFHPWFPESTMNEVRKHVRFTKYLRDLAIRVTQAALGEKFYAMHIRMGDYSWRRNGDSSSYLRRAKSLKWKLSENKLYIATEPDRDEKFFAPLVSNAKVVFSSNLPKELVQDFRNAFPKGKIRNDMVGLLEQLVAVQSKSFLGTFFSTFSAFIIFMRENKATLFPELVNLDTSGDGAAGDPPVSPSLQT